MTALEILTAARAKVAQGWTQRRYSTVIGGKRCFCAVGALIEVAPDYGAIEHRGAVDLLTVAATGFAMNSAVHWNDAPGRTRAEVLAAFDKAIDLAKEGR